MLEYATPRIIQANLIDIYDGLRAGSFAVIIATMLL